MPSFFTWPRMAELDRVFGAPFLGSFQQCGLFGTLEFLALLCGVGALVAGMAKGRQQLLRVALALALVGSLLGWAGAFIGYVGACRIAAGSTPKQSELVEGANRMAWTALVPTTGALPLLLTILGLALHARTEREVPE